ncbi:ABC transporter ATP-binding protein [Rubripirellula reticaptiva]|uniref:sn-glycerol-3-phosphate import ATP-binding protein UgpC n=1 Tax=Rubripirellula reticaptiva TaxID=2528013 RepID=A0A5C6F2M0_9BACT|nr:ABC transporter ATP-binding protein [Rubripirellula reticaptiva]TWU55452.1 sn-glycerol-3-phosphate import ATP-binding protein UgpC [Rubripirellula reticaptiva]
MSHVELRDIHSMLGGVDIIKGLNFRFPSENAAQDSNPYIVLLGASGCGKSTMLRIIAGLLKPDSGEVVISGKDVCGVPSRKRDVSMVFQHDALYPHLTISQSLDLSARRIADAEGRKAQIERAIELTGIAPLLQRRPDRLSGGEIRRASIAKMIARKATVRLLDEPLSALDGPVRQVLARDLRLLHDDQLGTTIHVTHDGNEAMRMADAIAVMDNGVIVQFAPPTEIYDRPASINVARTIGSPMMNFFAASIDRDRWTFQSPAIQLDTGFPFSSFRTQREIVVGVRPEHFEMQSSGDAALRISMPANEVAHSRVSESTEMTSLLDREAFTAVISRQAVASSDPFVFSASQEDLHFFDADTGLRIESGESLAR